MITQDRLKQLLRYDPNSGQMTWISHHQQTQLIGKFAGALDGAGYVVIGIDNKLYRAHRLAFLYMTGSMPPLVDHINGVKSDNQWGNLRASNKVGNAQNIRKAHCDSKSGLLGVEISRDKFSARISISGKRIGLGTFDTAQEAHEAYMAAKRKLHDNFERATP